MAKLQVMTLDNLTLYDELIKGYVDDVDAKSLKTVAIDGNTLKFYRVEEPVGTTTPAYEITLPETDISNLMAKLSGATVGNVVTVAADGEVADGGVALADLATKAEVKTVSDAVEAINNADSGILAQAKEYADEKDEAIEDAKKAGTTAQADVDALEALVGVIPEGYTATTIAAYAKELADNVAANGYDDTEVRGLIEDNTDAIAVLNGDAEGSVKKAVADAKALVDADVDAVEGRLDAIENADTGILASAKAYADEVVEDAVEAVKSSLASALTYKGQKATESELPADGNVCGDVWNVATTDKGTSAEFVWVVDDVDAGTGHWEELGTALDLSAYAEKEQVADDIATAKEEAIEATTALAEGQVATNKTNIEALQTLVGDGCEAIPDSEINALFA